MRELIASVDVRLDKFHVDIRRHLHDGLDCNAAAAIYDYVADSMFVFVGMLENEIAVLMFENDKHQIAVFYLVITAWDDGVGATFDGYHAILAVVEIAACKAFVQHFSPLAHFDRTHFQIAAREHEVVAHPVGVERVANLFGCQNLRIDEMVQAKFLEETFVFREQKLVIVDSSKRFVGA